MNLIDAVKSGLPFRRPRWLGWVDHAEVENFAFSVEDLTADDYYLDEPKVTITRSQLNEAWRKLTAPGEPENILERELLAQEFGL